MWTYKGSKALAELLLGFHQRLDGRGVVGCKHGTARAFLQCASRDAHKASLSKRFRITGL